MTTALSERAVRYVNILQAPHQLVEVALNPHLPNYCAALGWEKREAFAESGKG